MKYLLSSIFFCLSCTIGFSQESLKDTLKLEEVIVSGIIPRMKDKSAVPVQSITRQELDRVSGYSVADAVRSFSGVTLKDYGGIGGLKTIMVRSLGANHTGVFMDGVLFSDVSTGQTDLGSISTLNTGTISLYIGHPANTCQPARYYATANVINIKADPPDFIEKRTRVKTALTTGSFGLFRPAVSLQSKVGTATYTDVSASYTAAHGRYPFHLQYGRDRDTTSRRTNSDIESLNLNAGIVSVLSDSSKVTFRLYYHGSERGLPGAVVYYNPFSSQRLSNRDFFTNIQYANDSRERTKWLTNLKFSQNMLQYSDPDYLNSEGKIKNHYLQREYYFSQALSFRMTDDLQLSMASDFFINSLDANLYQYAKPLRVSSLTATGLHFHRERFEVNGNLLATLVREKTLSGLQARDRNIVTPSFFMSFKILQKPSLRLRFMYKDVFRMPSFNDLYFNLVGNHSLEPENAKQYNAGLTGYGRFAFFDYASFKADLFYNRVKDKIVAVPTKNLFVWSMQNIGEVDIKGMELQSFFQTSALGNVEYSLTFNYTYQVANDVTTPGSPTYKQQVPYIPFETFSALSSMRYGNVSISCNTLFNGYRYVLGENIHDNLLPSWWVTDVSALYDVSVKKYELRLKAEISNLLDRQYDVIRSFPMPGRGFSFSVFITY